MTKKARVLILTSTYPRWHHDTTPGFVADFAQQIASKVERVDVLAPHYQGAALHEAAGNLHISRYHYFFPARLEDIAYNGGAVSKIKKTPVYALKLLFFMGALFFHALFITLVRRPTVINAHWLIPQGFIGVFVKFLTGRKLIITIHGSDVLSLNGKYMRIIKRFTLRHADVVCVNSSVTRAACEALYMREYIQIPMGIDMAKYDITTPSEELKKRYDLGDFTILFVGRLSREKGIIYLLEALKQLKASGRHFKALIVGSGPLEKQLKAFIDTNDLNDVVTLVGWIDSKELPQYYAAADILVGPSLHEAQGLVFLEALAAGLPVLTTNQGGMTDFIEEGNNGLMVDPKSADALYEKLTTLYDDRALLDAIASHAASSVKDDYSWDSVRSRYLELFEAIS